MLNYLAGSIYLKLKEYQKAVDSFKKEIANYPDDYKSYYYLGVAYKEMKLYDKALEAIENALKIKKDDFSLYDYYIRVTITKGMLEKAKEYIEKGKANCPNSTTHKTHKDKFLYFEG